MISSPADLISGGDALLAGTFPGVQFAVAGVAVSVEPRGGNTYVAGLPQGSHELVGTLDGAVVHRLSFTSFDRQGPMIAGAWEWPFFCQTETFSVGPGAGMLGVSQQPDCVVSTRDDRFRRTDAGQFDKTADESGVLVETGVINRSIYQIAMPPAWNGKLIYKFGGGCRSGWYRQGDQTAGVLDEVMLASGYGVASASLNVFGINCNDLLAAETMMMVKERFIERFGPPAFTMGFGCSGGSYQSLQIGDNYPGLLDGILVGCSFPEVGHAMVTVLADARLMKQYFDRADRSSAWTDAEKIAVTGFANGAVLDQTATGAARITSATIDGWASAEFVAVVPNEARYDPVARPGGARATVFDHTVNVYGRDPATGHARWPFDNRGIQYGLRAFRDGVITAAQFLDLNEAIGGFNRDGRFVAARTRHDPEATTAAYVSGRILDGGFGLRNMPIIDYRAWVDDRMAGDTHLAYHSYSTRERLRHVNGSIANHVMLTEDGLCEGCSLFSLASPVLREALAQLDRWLVAIAADSSAGTLQEKVIRDRPATLVDACWIDGEMVAEAQSMTGGRCQQRFPTYGFPRLVAGASINNNVVACHLRPAMADDLAGLSAEEAGRFSALFSDGVCDWNAPGENQSRPVAPWWQVTPPIDSSELVHP